MTTINVLYQVAVRRFERGAYIEAERVLGQIVQQMPEFVDAVLLMARTALEQRQYQRAMELLVPLTNKVSDHSLVLETLGRAYTGLNRGGDAVVCLERALHLSPTTARLHRYLSDAFFSLRNFEKAAEHASRAIQADPTDEKAHASMGNVFLETRHFDQASACYARAIELNPDNWQVFANQGMAYMLAGRLSEAKDAMVFANTLEPMNPAVTLPLCGLLIDLGDHDEAQLVLDKLSAMMPGNANVLRYAGINASKQGDLKTAVGAFIKALAVDENNAELRLRLGEALVREGKVENAVSVFEQLIAKHPDFTPAYASKAKAELQKAQLQEGFSTIAKLQPQVKTGLQSPLCDGTALDGKKVLLYSQFGEDELILFARFTEALKAKGATTAVDCSTTMKSVLSAMASVDIAVSAGESVENVACHAPLEYLPALLERTEVEAMSGAPYLHPDSDRVNHWREHFGQGDKRKIGIMWRKESDVRPDIFRSVPLDAFAPLAALYSVELYSLQVACGKEELEACAFKDKISHVDELENADLAERLAAATALDLVISADSLTAQTVAAAGLPVWVLVGASPEWYWGEGESSIWYPAARLFRQSVVGRWDSVIESIVAALKE